MSTGFLGTRRRWAGWARAAAGGALALALSACGGGGGDSDAATGVAAPVGTGTGSVTGVTGVTGTVGVTGVTGVGVDAQAAVTRQEAWRLLSQASFGPTPADIARVQRLGIDGWLDEQLAMPATQPYRSRYLAEAAAASGQGQREPLFPSLLSTFYTQAMTAPDQLRQRTAFALGQLLVVSSEEVNGQHIEAMASYMDLMQRRAFGNYGTLLREVARHPAMGLYLSHLGNRKEDEAAGRTPDENFARELLQLFSIGTVKLNTDGTPVLDSDGHPVEAYTAADVQALARVFTGFSWAGPDTTGPRFFGNPTARDPARLARAMQPYPQFHSTAEKRLLGRVIPAQSVADPMASLDAAMDAIFAHPNVPPFVSRQLIQRLVTSQPSPAYVRRVAAVFRDNGRGVRGDLKAVVRAILTDTDARSARRAQSPSHGKLREPVLRLTAVLRAFGARSVSGTWPIGFTGDPGSALGQTPWRSPTVFNFYRPGYVAPGTRTGQRGMTVPELQITHETSLAGYVDYMTTMVQRGGAPGADIQLDLADERALAARPEELAAHVVRRLAGDVPDGALQAEIAAAVRSVPLPTLAADRRNAEQVTQARRNRVTVALVLTLASHEFLVQR
jgi:uncharacterized protein (DUF1800 family)